MFTRAHACADTYEDDAYMQAALYVQCVLIDPKARFASKWVALEFGLGRL